MTPWRSWTPSAGAATYCWGTPWAASSRSAWRAPIRAACWAWSSWTRGTGRSEGIELSQAELAGKIAVESGMDVLADLLAKSDSPLVTPAHQRLLVERPGYGEFGERKLRATSPWLYASVSQELLTAPDTLELLGAMDPRTAHARHRGRAGHPVPGRLAPHGRGRARVDAHVPPRRRPQPAVRESRRVVGGAVVVPRHRPVDRSHRPVR